MSLRSILDALRSVPVRWRHRARPAAFRPQLEPLGERTLPSFTPLASYTAGATAVIAADFNNDDVPDLALNTGVVLLGHGDGTFDPPATSGANYSSIAVGDLDDDGNLDLVIAGPHDVSVLLGNGDGTFADANDVTVTDPAGEESLSSVAVGDFNGDGLLDLGATSDLYVSDGLDDFYGYPMYHYESSLHVLVGTGDGAFSGPNTTSLGYGYHTAATAADFSGDGIDDLATINADYWTVSVFLGNSGGVLQGPTDHSAGYHPGAMAVADVDGDLDPDLVVSSYYGGVSVLLGDGAGGFAAAQSYTTGPSSVSVAVADFNGDGVPDIATTSNSYSNGYVGQIDVLLGAGDGTFAYPISQSLGAGTYASALAAADFNGDGRPDVAVTTFGAPANHTNVLTNAGGWVLPATLAVSDVIVTEGDSGTREAVFTVTRSGNLGSTVTVRYATANGDALAGSDYVAASGTLTFLPGETTKTIRVLVKGDRTDEYDQGFFVNLSNATGAVLTDSQGFCTILDNDPPPTVTITPVVSGKEGKANGTATFTFVVTLSAPSEKEVRVYYATADGTATTADSDYVARSGTLIFSPGQTTKSIPVTVKGDKKQESDETFFVNLTGATNATLTSSQGVGRILDDDPPPKGKR